MMKRREFLRRGGLAIGTAVSAPLILKSETLGLAGKIGANSRIGIGLIGNGLQMQGHRNNLCTNPRTHVLAVCDVDQVALRKAKKNAEKSIGQSVDAYEDYEDVIARPDIDAVLIATPDHWHAAIAIAAMRAGKDVYLEKPMTLTIAESKALVAAQKRYGRVLQVGSQQRSDKNFRKAAEMIRNNWIGDIKEVYTQLGSFPPSVLKKPEPIPPALNYDKWLGPAPYEDYFTERTLGSYGGGWRRFWEYGSRKNGDWGAHHFDIVQWAFGMDDSGPTLFVPKGYQGEPYQYHQYENGVKVVRDHPNNKGHMIRFIGKKGDVMVSRGSIDSNPAELARKPLGPNDTKLYVSDNHTNDWLNCIETRGMPISNVNIGHRSGTICLLSGIAERLNRPIRWDPVKQEIMGDATASRMMDRPRRAGYALPA